MALEMEESNKLNQKSDSKAENDGDKTMQSLFKRVKNYIILAMLILIFLNTMVVTFKAHLFSNSSTSSTINSLEMMKQLLHLAPNLGAIHGEGFTAESILKSLTTAPNTDND